MKICFDSIKLYSLLTVVLCAGNILGEVQPITGGQFDPPLVPTTNANETQYGHIYERVIVDDATLTALEINGILYADVQGPTNASIIGGADYWPINGTEPGSLVAAITNLTLSFFNEVKTADVYFASSVYTSTDGGFFFCEFGSSDDIYVYPLGSNGEPVSTWQLHLVDSDYGSDKLLAPHGGHLYVENTEGNPNTQQTMGGAAFTLADFTGGEGTLDNVTGLRIVDPNHTCDPVMIGIYRGPGESVFSRAGRAVRMQGATFDIPLVNPMTNDFALTGFFGAASITGASQAFQFDTRSDSQVLWPANGVQPTRTNALTGLNINGVDDFEYWDFMFAEPVTNAADGFFIVEDVESQDAVLVFPLDADRRPISTYSVATLPSYKQWSGPALMNNWTVMWDGSHDATDSTSPIGGVVMPLSAFAGGTGALSEVHGIRLCSYPLKWDGKRIDPLVVGSYTAWKNPRPVYDIETDPMPTLTPNADHIDGVFRHSWTLTSITLDTGRYTDLEGPANVVLVTPDWEYCIDDPTPPSSAVESAMGLDSSGLMNANNSKWYFNTTVTKSFDGGFFVLIDDDNDFTVRPIGTDSNVIAGYTVTVNNDLDLSHIMNSSMGLSWRRVYGHPPASTSVDRVLRGTSFTLDSFTNTSGESLTNDVIGIQFTDSGSIDPTTVGIYKGPTTPPSTGYGSPVTGMTFSPAPEGSSYYTNDVDVTGVQSALSESFSVAGTIDVYMHRRYDNNFSSLSLTAAGYGGVYYPVAGTNPVSFTNALSGLDMNGYLQMCYTEYMFERPVRQPGDGFFIIEHSGNDFITVRPLGADRRPISTYSVLIDLIMYGHIGSWTMSIGNASMRGTMIRKYDFTGGTGELGAIYGIRIEEPGAQFDPAVVGEFFGPLPGTVILVR